MELLPLVAITVVAFVSTNTDSLVVLVPLLSGPEGRGALLGYYIAVFIVLVLSWGISSAADLFPGRYINLLGVFPLFMGVAGVVRLSRKKTTEEIAVPAVRGVSSMMFLTLSLSGDNFGVFIPLFADTPLRFDPVIGATAMLTGVLWGLFARRLARAETTRRHAERWGPRVVPFLLIVVGLFILADTPADVW
ncbi:MAG: cadmium resistance transporter [Gammaproteobacteria bacterium]